MPHKIILSPAYISKIKKEDDKIAAEMATKPLKTVKCRYCKHTVSVISGELHGYYSVKCPKCGEISHHRDDYRRVGRYRHY